jgi:hypothetical protein
MRANGSGRPLTGRRPQPHSRMKLRVRGKGGQFKFEHESKRLQDQGVAVLGHHKSNVSSVVCADDLAFAYIFQHLTDLSGGTNWNRQPLIHLG